MERAWVFNVGPGGAAMNSATAAIDGGRVFVGATPNLLYGLGGHAGDRRWVGSTDLDLFAYQPVTVANGVLYAITDAGYLIGVDSSNGFPLLRRSSPSRAGSPTASASEPGSLWQEHRLRALRRRRTLRAGGSPQPAWGSRRFPAPALTHSIVAGGGLRRS